MTKAYKTTTIKQDLMNRRTMMPMPTFTSRAKHQQPAHQMPEIPRSRIWRKTFSRGDGDCETRDRAGHALKHHKLRALKTKPWHHATTVIAQEFVIAPYHWKSSMGLRLQTYREQVVGVARQLHARWHERLSIREPPGEHGAFIGAVKQAHMFSQILE